MNTRHITVVTVDRAHKVCAPFYVRERESAKKIIIDELERCESAIERARCVAGALNVKFPDVSGEIGQLLGGILDLRKKMRKAA